jgi:hypothetical protein
VEKLLREGVAFFVIRQDGAAAGCGGVQPVDDGYGEIKRMYVLPPSAEGSAADAGPPRRPRYGARLHRDRLETGIHQQEALRSTSAAAPPDPALRALRDDPVGRCYEKRIAP